jgi:hypothetical protein
MSQPGELPQGIVTFLLTDIEASTPLWERHGAAMGTALAGHQELIARAVAGHGAGHQAAGRGRLDAVGVHPGQRRHGRGPDPAAGARSGAPARRDRPADAGRAAHREAELRDGDYFGPALNRAARLRSLSRGGQVLLSRATAELGATLDSALGGQGKLVLVAGEAGIGKTRLAEELCAEASAREARGGLGALPRGDGARLLALAPGAARLRRRPPARGGRGRARPRGGRARPAPARAGLPGGRAAAGRRAAPGGRRAAGGGRSRGRPARDRPAAQPALRRRQRQPGRGLGAGPRLRPGRGRPGRFRFAHALVHETLYEELPARERRRLHDRVGAALVELRGDDFEGYLAELAHHSPRRPAPARPTRRSPTPGRPATGP